MLDIGALWDQLVVHGIFVASLRFLYNQLKELGVPGTWGVAIIAFTIIVKTLTLPLTLKSVRSMKRMQEVQPKLQALQKQYKNDKETLMQEQMKLYKEHGVNPVAGCLPMVVQMPIWIALYWALFALSTEPEFSQPFLWIASLGKPEFAPENFPSQLPILAVLTGVTQWVTTRMSQQPSQDPQQQTMNQVMQFMPLMFIFFSLSVPAGLVLYWVASNVYQMVQQYFVTGWGMLLPQPAAAPAGRVSGSKRSAAVREPAAVAKGPENSGSDTDLQDDARVPRTSSTGGRRRKNKRR